MMEVTKMREWLTEFKTLVTGSPFELQIIEGILYPYLNVQDETKYMKYLNDGGAFGNISDSIGNALYVRYTESPIRYSNKMASVDLVMGVILPHCHKIREFTNLIVQRLQAKLVIEGDIEVQTNLIEAFKTEVSEDTTKLKTSIPLATIAFTIKVPQSNTICTLEDLACGCEESQLMSC